LNIAKESNLLRFQNVKQLFVFIFNILSLCNNLNCASYLRFFCFYDIAKFFIIPTSMSTILRTLNDENVYEK